MPLAKGADFSSAQPPSATSKAVHEHGISFALVKTTEAADYVNPVARAQVALLEAAGVKVGLYHFLAHDIDGATQWEHFEKTLRLTRNYPVVACDQESDRGVLVSDAVARAFIHRGQQRGYRVGRYGDARVMGRRLGEDWRWYARWAATPPPGRWAVWQFSDGRGSQDWDVFNGTVAELAAWWQWASEHRQPVERWWIHDEFHKTAIGPLRLPQVPVRLAFYIARHRRVGSYLIVRK